MIPVPFSAQPGDKLRVTADKPYGTELVTGDLVTVEAVDVRVEGPGSPPFPVVIVSTAHGRQILGLDAVEPYDLPSYTPAEPDEIIDARLRALAAADPELGTWATDADTALGAEDATVSSQLGGGTAVATVEEPTVTNRRFIGQTFGYTDSFGDTLTVGYFEQDCEHHGREGIFLITATEDGEPSRVAIPATQIEGLLRYLFQMKKHSERSE